MKSFKDRIKVNLPKNNLSKGEARKVYEKFVLEQEESFILFINYLNRYVNELREKGEISPFLKFYARVKATNSALENHDKKALDDVFGIEFICATDREIQVLQKKLEQLLKVRREKLHNKDNGYRAVHHSCTINNDTIDAINNMSMKQYGVQEERECFPAVEIQYKTIEVYYEAVYGKASHEVYKEAELSKIQELYDKGELEIGEDFPDTWISNPEGDRVRKMSTEEVLKKMYPSLALKSDRQLQL